MADSVETSGGAPTRRVKKALTHWWHRAAAAKDALDWAPATMPTPRPLVIRAERVSRPRNLD